MLSKILDIFTSVSVWIKQTLTELIPLFYVESTGLTFFGVLAVVGLGISVIFLMLRVIQNFLHFRG